MLGIKIYDRWGELVHDSVEPWNGKYKGKRLPSDGYIYIIVVATFYGIEEKKGM